MLGKQKIPWDRFCEWIAYERKPVFIIVREKCRRLAQYGAQNGKVNLGIYPSSKISLIQEEKFITYLLHHTRSLEASLPHDKIYGMFPFLKSFIPLTEPSYFQDVSELYAEVTINAMKREPYYQLELLEQLPTVHRSPDLPSWVPDFNEVCDFDASSDGLSYFRFAASSHSTPSFQLRPGWKLGIKGIRIDVIRKCTTAHISKGLSDEFSRFLLRTRTRQEDEQFVYEDQIKAIFREWHRLVPKYDSKSSSSWIYRTELGQVLIQPSLHENLTEVERTEYSLAYFLWEHSFNFNSPLKLLNGVESPLSSSRHGLPAEIYDVVYRAWSDKAIRNGALQIHQNLLGGMFGNSLFMTEKSRLGLGYHKLRENDIVVLLAGGRSPFILRPSGDDCEFVGPAYVKGVMGGEEWPEHLPEELMETFILL